MTSQEKNQKVWDSDFQYRKRLQKEKEIQDAISTSSSKELDTSVKLGYKLGYKHIKKNND